MRTLLASAGLALLLALATQPSVSAQEPPGWMKQTLPDQALKPHWDEQRAVMNPTGALDGKTKHLIGLAVAAQIPCTYCVYGHTQLAKAAGATDAQIKGGHCNRRPRPFQQHNAEWLGRRPRCRLGLHFKMSEAAD